MHRKASDSDMLWSGVCVCNGACGINVGRINVISMTLRLVHMHTAIILKPRLVESCTYDKISDLHMAIFPTHCPSNTYPFHDHMFGVLPRQ